MDYLKAAIVAVVGIALYYVLLRNYPSGAANFVGLVYVLMAIRFYQFVDEIWPRSASTSG